MRERTKNGPLSVGLLLAALAVVGVGCAAEDVESTAPLQDTSFEQTSALSSTSAVTQFQPNIVFAGRTLAASVRPGPSWPNRSTQARSRVQRAFQPTQQLGRGRNHPVRLERQ